uniref:Uncharacterized protein n=1 Tax=mine drainage metagenome TaxID=410659 RepID=E6QH71_9ZZZZ
MDSWSFTLLTGFIFRILKCAINIAKLDNYACIQTLLHNVYLYGSLFVCSVLSAIPRRGVAENLRFAASFPFTQPALGFLYIWWTPTRKAL